MMRSVIAAVGIAGLTASAVLAQMPNFFLSRPPPGIGVTPAPRPSAVPDVPLVPSRNVQVLAKVPIGDTSKMLSPEPPIWIGADALALMEERHGAIAMVAYQGDRFANSRVLADSDTVGGAAILDMAVSRDGKRLAIAAAGKEVLEVRMLDTASSSPAATIAGFNGTYLRAGLSWIDSNTLAIGAVAQAPPAAGPGAADPRGAVADTTHSVRVIEVGVQPPSSILDLACIEQIDPTGLSWSPDGHYAIGRRSERRQWFLLDRVKSSCDPLNLAGLAPVGSIEWGKDSDRFLFTATPADASDLSRIGVLEYSLKSGAARLIASPAAAAVYAGGGQIAVAGNRHLNAGALESEPDRLFPAEIAWMNPDRGELQITPIGFQTQAAALLNTTLLYTPQRQLLAFYCQAPGPKGNFPVLFWLSASPQSGGILATGQTHSSMAVSWSPDGGRLAVLAGLPNKPTLAVLAAPQ